jgi:hypothetical protein
MVCLMVAGPEGLGAVHARIAGIQARIGGVAVPAAGGLAGSGAAAVDTAFSDLLATAQGQYGVAAPSGVPVNGDMRSPGVQAQFASDLLVQLGMPQTPENMRAVIAWQRAEGTRAAFNPLATTQRADGASDFNSVGVKNYTSYAQGLAATVTTLRNGRYDEILAALLDGTSSSRVADAVARSPWGTGEGVNRVLAAGAVQ